MLVLLTPGETQADIDKVYLGRGDSPFTESGNEQVLNTAETLSPYQFDQVYASDLYRAQETLRAVIRANQYDVPWEYAEELRERSGGSYEGQKYSDIRKGMSPKVYKVWERDPTESPLHGESLMDVRDRIKPWWDEHVAPKLAENKNVLLVTHPDTMRVLVALARGDDLIEAIGIRVESGLPYFYYGSTR